MTRESIIIFFGILLFHWIFDFILQTDYQAKNKSRYTDALLGHTFIYSWSWICVLTGISITTNLINGTALDGSFFNALLFGSITCSAHTLTDFITSKSVKYYFDKKDFHRGFIVIGFDQILHYVQLVLTFYYIYKIPS